MLKGYISVQDYRRNGEVQTELRLSNSSGVGIGQIRCYNTRNSTGERGNVAGL